MSDNTTNANTNGDGRSDDGFEYDGTFYRWHVTDLGKDLMLIDRFSGLPVLEFFELIEDEHERTRGPILLTLIATSIRNGHADWSVERIVRLVMGLSLSDVEFVGGDEEEPAELPLLEAASTPPQVDESSSSTSNGSSSSSTPPESSSSETSSASPA